MPSRPSRDLIAEIRALDGEPKISYQEDNVDYPVTERIESILRGRHPIPFLSPEPDTASFPNNKLVEQTVIGANKTHVQVYRKYERVPGLALYSYQLRPDGTLERTARQHVLDGTLPTAGAGILSDRVDAESDIEAVRTTRDLVAADGVTPITTDPGYTLRWTDKRTRGRGATTWRLRPYNSTLPDIGSAFGVGTITEVKEQEIEGSTNVIQIIDSLAVPSPFVEFPEIAMTFPGIVRFNNVTFNSLTAQLRYGPPWAGNGEDDNTFYLLRPRHKKVQCRVLNAFSLGPSGAAIIGYSVYSPGVASRVLNVPDFTVHPKIRMFEQIEQPGGGVIAYTIEDIPASTPDKYDPKSILRFPLGETILDGNIYCRKVMEVSEELSPFEFPPIRESQVFKATSGVDLVGQPNPGGDRIYLKSSGADTRQVTIFGQRNTSSGLKYTTETVTLNGTNIVRTSDIYLWFIVTQVHLSSANANTVTVRGQGTPAEGSITWTAAPTSGDTITIGRSDGGGPTTYTYRSPGRVTLTCPSGGSLVLGASPGSYVSVTLNGVAHYFWFSNGTATDPAPGGTGHAVTFTGGDSATTIRNSLKASMDANLTTFVKESSGVDQLILTALDLGAMTTAQDAGADFGFTTASSGTATAANQVRTGWDLDGLVMTPEIAAFYFVSTLNGPIDGQRTSTGTTIHPTLAGRPDGTTTLVVQSLDESVSGFTWTLTETSAVISTVAIVDAADGPLIATIGAAQVDAYNDILFRQTPLYYGGTAWTDEDVDPIGGVARNLPAFVGTVTSDPVFCHGSNGVLLSMIASGSPAMVTAYEVGPSDTGPWSGGVATLPKIGSKRLYHVTIPEAAVQYIRFKITNPHAVAEAVHAQVTYSLV